MKTYIAALSVLSLGTLWLSNANAKPIETHRAPFAVVELFTSQGCSSCPPADAVLQQLHRERQARGERVYVLSFHVDYWNRLGWTDPYSQPEYSQRQRDYVRAFRQRVAYTPQMIVNGTSEFVGSRQPVAQREVDRALQPERTAEVGVGLAVKLDEASHTLSLDWQLDRRLDGVVLNLAVVEHGLSTAVPRGENRGAILEHDGVVRVFQTLRPAGQHGSLSLDLPEDLDPESSAVIAYVQDEMSKRIVGAHHAELTTAK